jgi:hypothetical protein
VLTFIMKPVFNYLCRPSGTIVVLAPLSCHNTQLLTEFNMPVQPAMMHHLKDITSEMHRGKLIIFGLKRIIAIICLNRHKV